jgi:hypothetical protein
MDAPTDYLPPTAALRRLAAFLQETGSPLSTADAATMAINQWIATERGQLAAITLAPTRGYQWKTLFLPDGSELRVNYSGQAFYARVQGDSLVYEGWPVSPREFATKAAGAGRNAWREVWVLLPGERKWQPASLLRRRAEHEQARQHQTEDMPKPVSPLEAMSAAAACMSDSLKAALALVEHANDKALPSYERRRPGARRSDDTLADTARLD